MQVILREIAALAAQVLDAPITFVALRTRGRDTIEIWHGDSALERESAQSLLTLTRVDPRLGWIEHAGDAVAMPTGIRNFGVQAIAADDVPLGALGALNSRGARIKDSQRECLARLAQVAGSVVRAWQGQDELSVARHALGLRERQLRTIADNLPAFIGYADAEQKMRFVNKALADFSPQRGDLCGQPLQTVLGAAAYEVARPAVERALNGERVTFSGDVVVNGSVRHREVTYVPDANEDGTIVGFFGIGFDVTERVRQARELHAREAHLSSILETMSEGLVIHGGDGRIVRANRAASRILGLTEDQLLGRTSMDPDWHAVAEDESLLPGELHPAAVSLRTGQPIRSFVMGVRSGRGPLRWLSVNSEPLFEADRQAPSGVLATFVDVTAQRELRVELERARADLRAVLDHVPVAICSWRADGTNRFANQLAEWGFGVPAGAAADRHLSELVGAERWARQRPHFETALTGVSSRTEVLSALADGTPRYFQVEWVPDSRDGVIAGAYSVVTDVTELRSVYERIRELARLLDRAGERERRTIALALHEGIAQDLYGMSLMLQQMQDPEADAIRLRETCWQLQSALEQCMADVRAVANNLRPSELVHLSIGDALRQQATQFSALTGVSAEVRIAAGLPVIEEARQLLLFRAAQEALTNVSKHARASRVEITLQSRSGAVELRVCDDGRGIREPDLAKAGTFGLLAIRERCREAGAEFQVGRQPERGTEFLLSLAPVAQVPAV